jgi:hypothetical protein
LQQHFFMPPLQLVEQVETRFVRRRMVVDHDANSGRCWLSHRSMRPPVIVDPAGRRFLGIAGGGRPTYPHSRSTLYRRRPINFGQVTAVTNLAIPGPASGGRYRGSGQPLEAAGAAIGGSLPSRLGGANFSPRKKGEKPKNSEGEGGKPAVAGKGILGETP